MFIYPARNQEEGVELGPVRIPITNSLNLPLFDDLFDGEKSRQLYN